MLTLNGWKVKSQYLRRNRQRNTGSPCENISYFLCRNPSELRIDHAAFAAVGTHERDGVHDHGRSVEPDPRHIAAGPAEQRDMRGESPPVKGNAVLREGVTDPARQRRERKGLPHPGPPEVPEAAHALQT